LSDKLHIFIARFLSLELYCQRSPVSTDNNYWFYINVNLELNVDLYEIGQ